jgi:hypothetical protein
LGKLKPQHLGPALMILTENEDDFVRNLATFFGQGTIHRHGATAAGFRLFEIGVMRSSHAARRA